MNARNDTERGRRIRQARERAGMSQEALAERLGVSRQAVSKWEVGASEPGPENLRALSGLLKIDVLPTPEGSVPVPVCNCWKAFSLVSISLCLLLLAGAALFAAAAISHGWLVPKDPAVTAIRFYDEAGNPIPIRESDGWYHFTPESRVTIAVTFQNGRKTLGGSISGVLGAALYLTPTGTGVYDLRAQLAVQAVHGGNLALFICQFPEGTLGHLDVVLECSGGQTITETFNVTTER